MSSAAATGGVLTIGESLGLVVTDGPLHEHRTRVGFGGAESNVAIALRRLGVPVTWVSRLGEDPFGDLIERELRAEGVTVRVTRSDTDPTGLMVKQRRPLGRSRVRYYRSTSAATRLTGADVTREQLEEAAVVHLTGITAAISTSAREAVLDVARRAREAGTRVSFDLNHRSTLWDRAQAAATFRQILPLTDVVFAGDDEARILFPEIHDPAELAAALAGLGPTEAVIKLGEHGALARTADTVHRQSAMPIEPVDTVGAGDGFVAGYLSEILAGAPVPARLRTGTQVGAYACLGPGDWESMPTRADLQVDPAADAVDR
ncbi:sugar kinase [Nakamurella sp.]|uniref:sugar kinase n=1 Tax=Nakamurella sp. TaxID=1869182 RepID=UPI00378324BD